MKTRIKNYLAITKKEWNGMVILVILIAGVLAAPYGYKMLRKDNTINFKDFDKAAAQLNAAGYGKTYTDSTAAADTKILHPAMFTFNPNNLSLAQWQQLGLSGRQANIIIHYQAKGGRFYHKADLRKIYGITIDDYKRLEPYINIPRATYNSNKAKTDDVVELNSADSAKLTGLNGIGPSFAVRIIRYRNRLGGFNDSRQLMEVYGMDTTKFAEIEDRVTVNAARINKVDINTISFNQLRIFPYLSYMQVNAIIQYRAQHGNYTDIADMKNVAILDEETLHKIEPYINFK